MQIKDIYQVVEQDFETSNAIIRDQLSSRVPLVEKIADYIISSGGKRMRPLLVLLTSGALSCQRDDYPKLAAVIEFLHTATLLHDDVVDTSDLRRGRSTANAMWGNAPSVLVGDFLYARAFQMMVELDDMRIMKVLSDATQIIAEGEVFQLTNCKNPDISEDTYFEVIKNKTAMLFEAATHSAAILAKATDEQEQACREFGMQLGLAFQLIDDVLDYTGDAETMGKNVGDDLAEGKPTLPLIQAMKVAEDADRQIIRKAIRAGDSSALSEICRIVEETGALDYTKAAAIRCQDKAVAALDALPESQHTEALKHLALLAVARDN